MTYIQLDSDGNFNQSQLDEKMIYLIKNGSQVMEDDRLYLFDNDSTAEIFADLPGEDQSKPQASRLTEVSEVRFYSHHDDKKYILPHRQKVIASIHPNGTKWQRPFLDYVGQDSTTKLYEKRTWPFNPKIWYQLPQRSCRHFNDRIVGVFLNNEHAATSLAVGLYENHGFRGRLFKIKAKAGQNLYVKLEKFHFSKRVSSAEAYFLNPGL